MSFQNTIKCMKKYNNVETRGSRPLVANIQELKTVQINEESFNKQCFKLNEILNDMKNVNFENVESEENVVVNDLHSPRILNLRQKKEELELKIKQHKPRKPNKPIPKIINSKIANINK